MSQTLKNWVFYAFLLLESVLYVLILTDNKLPNNIICYISIVLGVITMGVMFCKNKNWLLMLVGMIFTLVADTFLVLLNGVHKDIAMVAFNIAQICYLIKIWCDIDNKRINIISLIVRIVLTVGVELAAVLILKQDYSFLICVSTMYFANLFVNVIFSFFKSNIYFSIGLILFTMCDLTIGFQFLCELFNITSGWFYNLAYTNFNLTWMFYLPSQLLIVTSQYVTSRKMSRQKVDNQQVSNIDA